MLEVADANGVATAEQSFRVTRGPVGLLHGYLLGEPSDFDALAARLELEGFETYRMDLRRKIKFRSIARYPLPLAGGDVKSNAQNPGEKYLGRRIEVNPNIISFPEIAIPFPEWANTFLKWLAKIELPDWLPFIGNHILPEKGFPLGNPSSIGPAISLGCLEKSACFMGQFKGSFGLRMPGEDAPDPVTGEYTDARGALLARLGLGFSVRLPEGTILDPTTQSFKSPVSVGGYEVGSLGLDWHNRYWGQQGEIVVAPFVEVTSPAFDFKLANGDLFRYQADVKSFVETTLEKSGYHHMSLFGHDMGAVIARMYTSRAPVRDQVNKLLMTGGPQRGSDTVFGVMKATKWLVAWLSSYTGPFAAFIKYGMNVFIDAIYGDAGRMLEPHSTFLQGLNNNYTGNSSFDEPRFGDAMPPDVAVYNYVGRHYLWGTGPTLTHLHTGIPWGGSILGISWKLPNVDDFVIPWLSLTGDMIVSSPAARVYTGGNVFQTEQQEGAASWHFRLAKDRGDNFAKFIRDLEDPYKAPPLIPPAAAGATRLAALTMAPAAVPDTAPTPDAREIGAFEHEYAEADLRPGESVTLTVSADRTAMGAVFTTQSIGNVRLSVSTPHGPTLHADDPDPAVGASAVAIDSPEAGTYVATATLDPAAPVGALVQLTAAVRARTFLALKAAGPTKTQSGTDRVPGEDVHIGALFMQGFTVPESAMVRCGLHSPDGSDHDLPLFDDGKHEDAEANDGFHVALVWGGLVQREGTYQLTCDALGTFSGEIVKRHAELQIRVRKVSDHGIVPGSVRVEPASPVAGTQAMIRFQVFNHGEKALEFLPVEVSERADGGEERVIGCKAFAPLAGGATDEASVPWTVSGDACRLVTVGITGSHGADEINNDPQVRSPYADNVERVRVCPPPRAVTMVANAGGPYRYQGSNNKILLDATASQNTTERTAYQWTIVRISDGAVLATAFGRQAVVSMPKVIEAVAMLTLTDPQRGTALASTSIAFAGSALFSDRTPPTAVLVAPATAVVGQPVTLRSESTDDFGPPPVQIFRIPNLIIGEGKLAVGRMATVVFPTAGDYEIILNVQDAAGFRASTSSTVHVVESQPTIDRVVTPATFERGEDAEIYVQLGGLPRLAGAPVQVSFGVDPGTGTRVRTSIAEATTDACGFARVSLPGPIVRSDVIVEVLGTASCDPATGTCGGAVQIVNPTGAAAEPVDTLPPKLQIYAPAAGVRVLDACRPIPLSFSVSDAGSGVAAGSVSATLDGVALTLPGDCTSEICQIAIDPAGLRMGVHHLVLSARDVAGNTGTVQRDFRIEATLDTLVCRLQSPICASITPDGIIASLLANIEVARAREAEGDLSTAANNLAALLLEARAQSGVHVTSACAEALEEEGLWIIGTRWGQAPRQVYAALGATLP